MAKSADAFRTISEVAEWLETPAHVLRFWESKFTQVKPVKRAGGRRYYRPVDMELLGGIKQLLHEEGMTIKGVQKLLRERGVGHVAGLSSKRVLMDDEVEAPMAVGVEAEEATVVPFRAAPPERTRAPAPETPKSAPPAEPPAVEPPSAPVPPQRTPVSGAPEADDAPGTDFVPTDMDPGADHSGISEDVAELSPAPTPEAAHDAPPAREPAQSAPRALSVEVGPDPDDDALEAPAGLLTRLSARQSPLAPEAADKALPLMRSLGAWARKGTPG